MNNEGLFYFQSILSSRAVLWRLDWTPSEMRNDAHISGACPPVGNPCWNARLKGNRQDVKLTLAPNHVEEDYSFDLGGVGKNGDDIRIVIDLESHVRRW